MPIIVVMKKLVPILFILGVAVVIAGVLLLPNVEQTGFTSVFGFIK